MLHEVARPPLEFPLVASTSRATLGPTNGLAETIFQNGELWGISGNRASCFRGVGVSPGIIRCAHFAAQAAQAANARAGRPRHVELSKSTGH